MVNEVCAACPELVEESPWPRRPDFFPIVLTARRESEVVGAAIAWRADDGGHAAVVVAPSVRRQGIGGTLLAHLESAVVAAGWECPTLRAHGPVGFYRARSNYANSTEA
jgi:GNAT superfamily N-acetyltransferase